MSSLSSPSNFSITTALSLFLSSFSPSKFSTHKLRFPTKSTTSHLHPLPVPNTDIFPRLLSRKFYCLHSYCPFLHNVALRPDDPPGSLCVQPRDRADQRLPVAQRSRLAEFDAFVTLLQTNGIDVTVIEDTASPQKPDAIFPNNWVSFHEDGRVILYPMSTPNRRLERRPDVKAAVRRDGNNGSVGRGERREVPGRHRKHRPGPPQPDRRARTPICFGNSAESPGTSR